MFGPLFRLLHQILLWRTSCSHLGQFILQGIHLGRKHSVEAGTETQEMETLLGGSGVELSEVQHSESGSVHHSRVNPLFCLHISSSIRAGCHGADMTEAVSVHIFPDCSVPGSLPVASGSVLVDSSSRT